MKYEYKTNCWYCPLFSIVTNIVILFQKLNDKFLVNLKNSKCRINMPITNAYHIFCWLRAWLGAFRTVARLTLIFLHEISSICSWRGKGVSYAPYIKGFTLLYFQQIFLEIVFRWQIVSSKIRNVTYILQLRYTTLFQCLEVDLISREILSFRVIL